MANAIVAQHARVPLGSLQIPGQRDPAPVLITREWFRTLTLISDALSTSVSGTDLTPDQVLVGDGGSSIKTLPATTDTYVLTLVLGKPTWAPGGGGGGSPAAPPNSIQYNNAGAFGGIAPGAAGTVLTSNGTTASFVATGTVTHTTGALANHALTIGSGVSVDDIKSLAALADGEVFVGASGADPVSRIGFYSMTHTLFGGI